MSGATAVVVAGAALAAAGASAYASRQQAKQAEKAADQQAEEARRAENQADQEFNLANQNQPDIGALLNTNTTPGSSTQLVGAGSAPLDPNSLGKGSGLLGG